MKLITISLLVCSFNVFNCVQGWERGALEKFGPFNVAVNSKAMKCNRNKDLNLDVRGMDVYFYDFQNGIERVFPIEQAANGILSIPTLDKVKKFFIFVGGYKSNMNGNTVKQIKNAFTNFPNSYLIIIDHSAYTHAQDGYKKSYERSVTYVYYIGKKLAQMLAELNKNHISSKNMHCIGHSLGSQILGHTGENFIKLTRQRIARITALDPAGPCFAKSLIQEQIRSGVADYVEVYHCNAGGLGTSSVLGDVDFFVNNGGVQPNCGTPLIPGFIDSSKAAKCNHKTCVNMWTSSVTDPKRFVAYKCDKYKHFKNGKCSVNDRTIAGFWNPGKATGVYYFSTSGYKL